MQMSGDRSWMNAVVKHRLSTPGDLRHVFDSILNIASLHAAAGCGLPCVVNDGFSHAFPRNQAALQQITTSKRLHPEANPKP